MDGFNAGFAATTAFIAQRVELVSRIGPVQYEPCFLHPHTATAAGVATSGVEAACNM